MNVGGISNAMASQLYQVSSVQKSGGQVVQQPQQTQPQEPSEESKESAAMQSRENRSGGETTETRSVDTYA